MTPFIATVGFRLTSLIKKSKSEYFVNETTKNLNNPSKFWKIIKASFGNISCNELPPYVMIDSGKVTDKQKMLACFNEHFISSGSLFESLCPVSPGSCVQENPSDPCLISEKLFFISPLSINKVHKALQELDTKKSAGPDNLDPFFLKLAADFIAEPLSYIFNLTIVENDIPKVWKSAHVTPLLKGGDPSILNNYRPISKLCILSKLLECLIGEQLKEFLNINDILSPFQSGFRKQHSTISAALKVINDITGALDNRKIYAALFIDLSKAFDTVDHCILVNSLVSIGLSKHSVDWFANYLSGRTQSVRVAGSVSSFLPISKGVPQGSVLGPILFSIYINKLCENLSNAMYHFYADDTVIYCTASSTAQALELLQSAFNTVQNRLKQLKLVLNVQKSKIMVFTNSRQLPVSSSSILTSEGNEIELVNSYKYLGIIIDSKLCFRIHVNNLVSKLRIKLGYLYRLKSCLSIRARKYLVMATFLPILDYGDLIYMNASAQCLKKLDVVYHCALRSLVVVIGHIIVSFIIHLNGPLFMQEGTLTGYVSFIRYFLD